MCDLINKKTGNKLNISDVLIVSDFDGTLRNDNGKIPKRNKTAIERFKKEGGTFIVASGRAEFVLDVCEPCVKELVNAPCILSNGSYLYDCTTKERTLETCLEPSRVREFLYFVRDFAPESAIRIVRGEEYLTPDENEAIKKQIELGYMQNVKVYTYDTIPVDKINKITVVLSEEKILTLRKMSEEMFSDVFDFNMSWKTIFEIQAKNVSKGNLLSRVRERYNAAGKDVKIFAVGDYENDIDMMRKADYACCPSNSLDVVKDFCKIHLCSNNDGAIADLIEKIENGEIEY